MATKKYVSLEKLGLFKEKIDKVISDGDAASLDAAKTYADGLAGNYEAAGTVATGVATAKSYTDEQIAAVNTTVAGVKTTAEKGVADAATADGKAVAAQNAADAAQADVDALETLVGTLPEGTTATSVVDYVNVKTAGIATDAALEELQGQLNGVQGEVSTIKGDYLKAADKSELQGNIDTLSQTHTTDKAALEASIKAITDDYLKEEDKTELAASIKSNTDAIALLTNGADAETIDGVNDLIAYVNEHGTEVTAMQGDIADNTEAIEGVAGRVTTLEGEMDDVQGAVATKAEKTYVDEAVEALQGEDTDIKGRLDNLEAAVGESGSVAEDIATAKGEAIAAAAEDATAKANAAETNAKNHADSLNTTMNTRVEALEAVDHEHSNKALLDTYTQTEANLADAVAKKHEHSNLAVLEGITADKVTAWDKVTDKADQTALQGEIDRATAAEQALGARIDEFVECSQEDINNLFA